MPRQKDPAWASHTVVIEKEENKAGIAVTVKGWKCRYCKTYFWNHALMRLFEHLTFDSAMCTSGIDPCSRLQVEDSVIDAARSACLDKAIAKSSEKKRVAESDDVEAAGDRERAEKVQSKLRNKTVEVCEVNGALADFFDGLESRMPRFASPQLKLLSHIVHAGGPQTDGNPCEENSGVTS